MEFLRAKRVFPCKHFGTFTKRAEAFPSPGSQGRATRKKRKSTSRRRRRIIFCLVDSIMALLKNASTQDQRVGSISFYLDFHSKSWHGPTPAWICKSALLHDHRCIPCSQPCAAQQFATALGILIFLRSDSRMGLGLLMENPSTSFLTTPSS